MGGTGTVTPDVNDLAISQALGAGKSSASPAVAPAQTGPDVNDLAIAQSLGLTDTTKKADTTSPPNALEQTFQSLKSAVTEPTPGSLHSTMFNDPQDANEHVAYSTGGRMGLIKYRLAKQITDAHDAVVKAKPGEMFQKAVDVFKQAIMGLSDPATLATGAALSSGMKTDAAAEPVKAAAEEKPGIVKQVLKGKEVAQEPARTAVEAGAKASATDAGVAASETGGKGLRTLLDEPIAKAAKAERTAYNTINKAADTDLKSLYDYRSDLHDALEDPTNIGQKANLQQELKTTEEQIANGEATAAKNGVDPAMLDKAKGMTQQRYAMETAKQKLFNNESVVKGNVAHGAPETINVDSAIKAVENLDKPSRFAPEGTPTRLVQAFGEKGASALKQGLYDAQAAGQAAVKKQNIAKWIGGALGVGALGGGAAKVLTR